MTTVEVRQQLKAGDWVYWSPAGGREVQRIVLRIVYAGDEFLEDRVLLADGVGADRVFARPQEVLKAY